ncbi:MAG TPA: hypothetical protein VJV40_03450 [Thermodesulfobacteriota bacterium]|nr:hypothetical protein [Thermodesulfobacteriota bacterium]
MNMKVSLRLAPFFPAGLALTILFIASCYPSYNIPPPPPFAPNPSVQNSQDGVRITVIPSYWNGSPGNLQNYVTPFYVEIENFSGRSIGFDYSDIVLFDQFRTQYRPLNPQAVADIIQSSAPVYSYPAYSNVSIGIGAGYYGGYYGRPWGPYYGPYWRPFGFYAFNPIWYYPPPTYYYAQQPSTKDVITEALTPGSIAANASVRGYIFFKQMPGEVSEVTLNISYVIEDTPIFRTLPFTFPVLQQGQ